MINSSSNKGKGKPSLSPKKGEILGRTGTIVGAVFREPVHQVLEKVKNEPFFKWPNKMMGNPEKRTEISIVNITRTTVTPPRTVEVCGIILTSLSKRAD